MLNIGGGELLIILLVALIFLGPTRLPEVARQLGQTMSSLRSLASGFQAELEAASKPDVDRSMNLAGPTDQDEAIAATQNDPFAGASSKTDPATIKAAARDIGYDDDGSEVAPGGPTDLRDAADTDEAADSDDAAVSDEAADSDDAAISDDAAVSDDPTDVRDEDE